MSAAWWNRFPGRLRDELKALRIAGLPYVVDRERFKAGQLSLDVSFPHKGQVYALRAIYPEAYPYFEPKVYGLNCSFRYHQNPFGKNLCLIGRQTELWWPPWTLAHVLLERFPKLIAANTRDREHTAELEADQGEPLAVFYPTEAGSVFLVDSSWKMPTTLEFGWLRIGFRSSSAQKIAAVLRVEDAQHRVMCTLDSSLSKHFPNEFWGRWLRMPEFVQHDDARKFDEYLSSRSSWVAKPYWSHSNDSPLDVVGVIYPEEVRRREQRDGWVFLRRTGKRKSHRRGLPYTEKVRVTLVAAERAGQKDIHARNYGMIFANKTVALVGVGCIGASLALELAKAGCGLVLIDGDEVELAPSIRWPLGLSYLGWNKAKALQDFIGRNWPYTKVNAVAEDVSQNIRADEDRLATVDLVIDATAEVGVQLYLGDLCSSLGKTLIIVSSTAGGWGGRIARFFPGRREWPCPACLCHYEKEGIVTCPPSDPTGMIQPAGCGDVTFQGSGIDTSEISLAGARLALSTLSEGIKGAYPATSWDIATLSLRSPDGELMAPRLDTWRKLPHPECPNHHGLQ